MDNWKSQINVALLSISLVAAFLITPPVAAFSASTRPWMNKSLSPEQRVRLLISAMTLDDKIAIVHGIDPVPVKGCVGYVPPNPRLAIPALTLSNGRAGVGDGAKDVTVLPAPIGAAASWDTNLMSEFGKVIGEEEWGKGSNVALGPTIDVVRVPEWGRTFETYGEDPYLNGVMAVAEIKGIQSEGPLADANMYLTMNQESNRLKQDSIVDERTLQEIYLPPFAAAVKDGRVATVMCAYVKANGIYSCENPDLLRRMLKEQLGFSGWVMSDWGATHSAIPSANAGLDQEMPGAYYYGQPLKAAVQNGQVSVATLDDHVRRILTPMFRHGLFDKVQTGTWTSNVRSPEHDAFSRKVAEQGTVLLKNDGNMLPISDASSIAVFGVSGGAKPQVSGLGSSAMVAPYVVSPVDGIRKRALAGVKVSYSEGTDLGQVASMARAASVAIVFVSTSDTEEVDRPNLELPNHQDQLISTVATANPNTIVVLNTAGPILMPWIKQVRGILEAWYPGQEDGNAIAAVLYGDVNPSGKLPLTFPKTENGVPTGLAQRWPGVNGRSEYSEKLDVGYRWYDATNTDPLFPFGYGLSYTTFKLSHLAVSTKQLDEAFARSNQSVRVMVDVTNTGKPAGAEVVQVYVGQPLKNGEPPRQLRAFTKVYLKSGETRHVVLTLDKRAFSIYDTVAHRWVSPSGTYKIMVGTSSRDLPLYSEVKTTTEDASSK